MVLSEIEIKETLSNWQTDDAWVSWYGRQGYGTPFTDYHPSPSVQYGVDNCRLRTIPQRTGSSLAMTIKVLDPSDLSAPSDLKEWPPQAQRLIENAEFELTGIVMSSQIINIHEALNLEPSMNNPFAGKFTHVKFDVTKDIEKGKKVFTTHAIWFPENANIVGLSSGIRTTSYPWKDPN